MQRRQTEIIAGTDMNIVGEVELQYYNVLKILIDPELQPLKSRISMLYTSLTEHLDSEQGHIRKCKMNKGDYDDFLSRIASCNKVIAEQNHQADNIKKDLQKREAETDQLKKKQNDVRDTITRHKLELNIIQKESIKGLQEIEIKQQNLQNTLKKKLDQQIKIKQELQSRQVSLLNQQKFGIEEIADLQKNNSDITSRIDELREKIKEIQVRDVREKRNNYEKKQELNRAKVQKDNLKEVKAHLEVQIQALDKEIQQTAEGLKESKKNKDQEQRNKVRLEKQKELHEKQFMRKVEQIQKMSINHAEKLEELKLCQMESQQLIVEKAQIEKEHQMVGVKLNQILLVNSDLAHKKAQMVKMKTIQTEQLQKLISEREKNRTRLSEINSKEMQKNKIWKQNEQEQHEVELQNIQKVNQLKKINNQVMSYQLQHEKLNRVLDQVKNEQQKYGIEASHAHSKYFQTLEQLKVNTAQIQNLQRDNQEVENKCKHQQNLYEAVRSDRNLYSKDFLKFKDEINELKKKYKRMTYAVDQLREQIKNKDQQLVELDKDFKKVEAENVKIKADKNRAKAQILSNQEVIKNQENHVGHLKKIIQEAKIQKAKQQKDYDMVRNQRDILGTQLIKRNQQLAVLYEKIKLSNSNLMKGEIYSKEKERQLNALKIKLATLRNEFLSIDGQIRCIDDLRAQISFKEKQLLNQKAKIKALEDQLENPMNVHRWRQLQATNQQNYQRILKIQTLQRRLIAKTEEVEAKQNLIRDKEKLFMQLKNILARQPGSEIHQQLISYKQTVKEKAGHMKKMKMELQNAHQEMARVKYEVDRIRSEMTKMKNEYFELRQASEKQVLNQRNFAQQLMSINADGKQNTGIGEIGIMAIKK